MQADHDAAQKKYKGAIKTKRTNCFYYNSYKKIFMLSVKVFLRASFFQRGSTSFPAGLFL